MVSGVAVPYPNSHIESFSFSLHYITLSLNYNNYYIIIEYLQILPSALTTLPGKVHMESFPSRLIPSMAAQTTRRSEESRRVLLSDIGNIHNTYNNKQRMETIERISSWVKINSSNLMFQRPIMSDYV